MKQFIIQSIAICLTVFALPFMVACSQEEPLPSESERDIQAFFTLDLGDAAYEFSRATPSDGEYETGSGLENFIDLPNWDFRCYLFDKDNRLVSPLNVVSIFSLEEKKYMIRLRLNDTDDIKNALTNGCRFMFLANWGEYPDPIPGMTVKELCESSSAMFDFSQQKTSLSDNNLIPMYGIKEFENGVEDYKNGKSISDIGTLHLLRAYAKIDVDVRFENFMDAPSVISVSLTHSNDKGYKAPANVTSQNQYVTGSWHTDYTPVNIPSSASDIQLTLTKDDKTGHYIAYVPEYRNVDGQKNPLDSRARIKINFTFAGIKKEGYVDFCYSDNPPTGVTPGQHFDIARNNWYKYNITVRGKDLYWTVDVIPFTSVELKPDYGLEREEFTGYIIGKDSQNRNCWYDGNYYDTANAIPLYLGTNDKPGEFVRINGKDYLLVYADYERTAAKLDHIFEKETRKKYLLYPAGRTGYENVNWAYYLNDLKQHVWLDETNLRVNCCRTINEWDRQEYSIVAYNWAGYDHDSYNPRFWFDVLGNRYPWSEGDTADKRKSKLGEWVKYLE